MATAVTSIVFENGIVYSAACTSETRACHLVPRVDTATHNAYGSFEDDVDVDGWGKLWLTGDNSTAGWFQAGACCVLRFSRFSNYSLLLLFLICARLILIGFLEGALTASRIYQHYTSWYDYQFKGGKATPETIKFLLDQVVSC